MLPRSDMPIETTLVCDGHMFSCLFSGTVMNESYPGWNRFMLFRTKKINILLYITAMGFLSHVRFQTIDFAIKLSYRMNMHDLNISNPKWLLLADVFQHLIGLYPMTFYQVIYVHRGIVLTSLYLRNYFFERWAFCECYILWEVLRCLKSFQNTDLRHALYYKVLGSLLPTCPCSRTDLELFPPETMAFPLRCYFGSFPSEIDSLIFKNMPWLNSFIFLGPQENRRMKFFFPGNWSVTHMESVLSQCQITWNWVFCFEILRVKIRTLQFMEHFWIDINIFSMYQFWKCFLVVKGRRICHPKRCLFGLRMILGWLFLRNSKYARHSEKRVEISIL